MRKCKKCNKEFSDKTYRLHIKRCNSEKVIKNKEKKNEINPNKLTVKELKSKAKEKNITGYSKMIKKDLIKAIKK